MTMDEAFEISNILRCASPASRTEIASFAYMKRYEKGQHVFYDREDLTCFYILLEGMVSLYKLSGRTPVFSSFRRTGCGM